MHFRKQSRTTLVYYIFREQNILGFWNIIENYFETVAPTQTWILFYSSHSFISGIHCSKDLREKIRNRKGEGYTGSFVFPPFLLNPDKVFQIVMHQDCNLHHWTITKLLGNVPSVGVIATKFQLLAAKYRAKSMSKHFFVCLFIKKNRNCQLKPVILLV